jgi:N-acetyl-anhydromuramyl-L-alanine amidase AmpD
MKPIALLLAPVFTVALALASGVACAQPVVVADDGKALPATDGKLDLHAPLKAAFAEAYLRYPHLPAGVLEAQAFVASRWQHRQPVGPYAGHHGMPQSYGVMGLYRGQPGFADQVGDAAKLLGVEPLRVARELHWNVLGAAALLDAQMQAYPKGAAIEDIAGVLQSLSGIRPAKSDANAYARASHAFDLLLTLDRGHDDDGIRIAPQPIAFERAFDVDTLLKMRAPFVRLDLDKGAVEVDGLRIDPISETLVDDAAAKSVTAKSTDYGPALWQASPNFSERNASVTHVTVHTTQGSYAGALSWLTNSASQVSAHYLIRSSDGQVAQMVRESQKAWHVGTHNPYTLGIEHEGWVDQTGWYTTAMYNASSALTRHFCARYTIPCSSVYSGAASAGISVQPSTLRIKGHQHYSSQSHTDPGRHWDWARYASLVNPGASTPVTTVLDNFEASEGRFNTAPAYSGSTVGISASSTAERTTAMARNGSASQHITLLDNASISANWEVRHLSASGNPSGNAALNKAGGRVGFWAYTGATGVSLAMAVDDSDGTERSVARSLPANQWTYVEWKLDDAAQWDAWVGGNGTITAVQVSLDALWIYRAQTSYTVHVYIDDVQYRFEG